MKLNDRSVGQAVTYSSLDRPGARIAWGAEINLGGHEKFIYVNLRGAREVYSSVEQAKKVKTKKKRSSEQKFQQILVVVSKFLQFPTNS